VESELQDAGDLIEMAKRGEDIASVEQAANSTPVVRFVNLVLYQALQDRASDIHFEPFENEFKIRYRVDGALYEMAPPPKHLALPVTSRLKVVSGLNIAERRLPQDGRIQLTVAGRPIDFRVSTCRPSSAKALCCACSTAARCRRSREFGYAGRRLPVFYRGY
jgi:type IV pilus assembly protein PilB